MHLTATYSPEDNKLRLYASQRLDPDTYTRVKAAGFAWAPKQDLFVAPMWTPEREDLLIELCGEIEDEDKSLVERAEERAERFEDYSDRRAEDASAAHKAVSAIADHIPLGQPILVGHHSEKHARKDAERIENGMRRAVRMWEQSQYWQDRAKGAIRAAKYKELPAVRARRIKGLEADLRKRQREVEHADMCVKVWSRPLTLEQAQTLAGNTNTTPWGTYSDLREGKITPEQATEQVLTMADRIKSNAERWIQHLSNRLEYERAMLAESGGTVADRNKPEKGGACRCWASPNGGWSYIQKVNKISVTVLDNWGNGGGNFTRTIEFDKLKGIMSAAEVREARESGRLTEAADKTGFFLMDAPAVAKTESPEPCDTCDGKGFVNPDGSKNNAFEGSDADPVVPCPECEPKPAPRPAFNQDVQFTRAADADFAAMRETLRAGVQVVSAPQLFPTPPDLARRMVEVGDVQPGQRVLEPSAGTGNLVSAILNRGFLGADCGRVVAVEVNAALAESLRQRRNKTLYANDSNYDIRCSDFLSCNGDLGTFDRIIMNPPFADSQDIEHVRHAYHMLKDGGRLVAIMSEGPFFRQDRKAAEFRAWLDEMGGTSEQLPADTFKESGTGVNTRLVVIDK